MESTTYNYKTQKATTRDDGGQIQSIKPIYDASKDPYSRVHQQANELEAFAKRFPENKLQVEINAIPEDVFKTLKEDFDYRPGYHDLAGKFLYCPTPNSVLIVHKEI